jgi:ferredoxin
MESSSSNNHTFQLYGTNPFTILDAHIAAKMHGIEISDEQAMECMISAMDSCMQDIINAIDDEILNIKSRNNPTL